MSKIVKYKELSEDPFFTEYLVEGYESAKKRIVNERWSKLNSFSLDPTFVDYIINNKNDELERLIEESETFDEGLVYNKFYSEYSKKVENLTKIAGDELKKAPAYIINFNKNEMRYRDIIIDKFLRVYEGLRNTDDDPEEKILFIATAATLSRQVKIESGVDLLDDDTLKEVSIYILNNIPLARINLQKNKKEEVVSKLALSAFGYIFNRTLDKIVSEFGDDQK